MAEDNSDVKPIEASAPAPLNLKSKLAGTPSPAPKYRVKVKNLRGKEADPGVPRPTRVLIALINVHAAKVGTL